MKCPKCKASLKVEAHAAYSLCDSCKTPVVIAHPFPKPEKIERSVTPGGLRLIIDPRNRFLVGALLFTLFLYAACFTWLILQDPEPERMMSRMEELLREESVIILFFMLPSLIIPVAVLYLGVTYLVNRKVLTVDGSFITRSSIPLPGIDRPIRLALDDIKSLKLEYSSNLGYSVKAVTQKGKTVAIWPADSNPFLAVYVKEKVEEFLELRRARQSDELHRTFSKALDEENGDLIVTMLDSNPGLAQSLSEGGRTALTVAASLGHSAMVKMLIAQGAEVNTADLKEYRTPLHYACIGGHEDIVDILLAHRARVNVTDGEGVTPLHFALAGRHREIAKKLTALGAHETITYTLKEPGFPLQLLAPFIAVPLFFLIVFTFIGNNVHMAANSGNLNTVKAFIERNPRLLNEPSAKLHETPLHEAARMGRMEVIKYLVEQGADCSLKDSSGYTPIARAIERGQNEAVRYLFPHVAAGENSLLRVAAANENREAVTFLLEKGYDVNAQDEKGKTALHYAVGCDSPDLVKLLIEKGADVNASCRGKNGDGRTPLHYARSGKVVRMLVRKGAQINALDTLGRTPLHYAAEGSGSAVEELIALGAGVNVRDASGKTPLWYARSYRYSKKVLQEHGGKE